MSSEFKFGESIYEKEKWNDSSILVYGSFYDLHFGDGSEFAVFRSRTV